MKKKLRDFQNFKLFNSEVIFGGSDDDEGSTEKKKLKIPTKGVEEGEEDN